MNVFDAVRRHAVARPDHPALVSGDRTLSYGELAREAVRWSGMLQSLGLRPGDRMGLALRETPEFAIAILAGAHAGIAQVPLDWRLGPEARTELARRFDCAAVLGEPGLAPLPGVLTLAPDESWRRDAARQAADAASHPAGDLPFAIKLSSGTTGQPKGAVATHREISWRLARNLMVFGPMRNCRYLSVMPLSFSGGNNYLVYHLMLGSTVILHPPLFTAQEYVELVRRNRVNFALVVPTVLRWLLEIAPPDRPLLPELDVLATSTAPTHAEEKRAAARRLSPNFYEIYASSAAGLIAALTPADLADRADSVGRPNPGLDIEVVDPDGRPLPDGETGRLRCRGPGICGGYYGDPDQAPFTEKLLGGWCYTGDLGALHPDGYLYVHGRVDDLIICGGLNVQPAQVEAVLMAHAQVREAAVIGRPAGALGEQVVAFVTGEPGLEAGTLLAHCRSRLAPHMVPAEIRVMDALPRTGSGKILKRELRARLG